MVKNARMIVDEWVFLANLPLDTRVLWREETANFTYSQMGKGIAESKIGVWNLILNGTCRKALQQLAETAPEPDSSPKAGQNSGSKAKKNTAKGKKGASGAKPDSPIVWTKKCLISVQKRD